jgi:hypothetical protein
VRSNISRTSVADPHHLDADSYDILPFDADPFLIQIGIVADPDLYVLASLIRICYKVRFLDPDPSFIKQK